MSYREDQAAVKRLTRTIEQAEAEAEAAKWERAERLSRMAETKTQRQVAVDVGLSAATVNHCVAIWKRWGDGAVYVGKRPTYTKADYEVAGRGPAERPESPEKIAERVAEDRKYAKAIIKNPDARAMIVDELMGPERRQLDVKITDPASLAIHAAYRHYGKLLDAIRGGEQPAELPQFKEDIRTWPDELEEAENEATGSGDGTAVGGNVVAFKGA